MSLYFASVGANAMLWPVLATIIRVAVTDFVSLSLEFIFDVGLVLLILPFPKTKHQKNEYHKKIKLLIKR